MKSLFKAVENTEVVTRINSLKPDSPAIWGKMNVGQMLAHCQQPLRVAFGESKLKRGLIGLLFGKMIKKQMVKDDKPMKKNSPTDKTFIIADKRNFNDEKLKLIELVQRFAVKGPAGISKEKHPFFGDMTPQEWDIIQSKHLDHHLRQFGA